MTQVWVIECPYCHREIQRTSPPCPHCGVWWGAGDYKLIEAGPPGTHAPLTELLLGVLFP